MKGKSKVQIPQRRAAGLQIKAALEPRPDSGANLASEIFGAVREEQETKLRQAENISQTIVKSPQKSESLGNRVAQKAGVKSPTNNEKSFQNAESEIVQGTALVRFGGGQMRVVSLQEPKPRKANKQPKKPLQIITGTTENQKIPALFERTKAEELYDLLYQLTLGAEEPCDSVRVRRSDLMASTNIKTRLTLDLNLKRLEENELLKIESRPGEQEGNIYTVFPIPNSD